MQVGPGDEFAVASLKQVPTRSGEVRFIDQGAGCPGTGSPTTFRCGDCILVTLVERAFSLQRFQLVPADWKTYNGYQVDARIPIGTTQQQFRMMPRNRLVSDNIAVPVTDGTGLTGFYDLDLLYTIAP
jgi:uncharacterized protein (TIGR03435 family)